MTDEGRRQRDAEIHRLRRLGLTLQDIGDRFGLTRERVRQLCSGITPPKNKPMREARNCTHCGNLMIVPRRSKRVYCSMECYGKSKRGGAWSYYTIQIYHCDHCGQPFERSNWLDMVHAYSGCQHRFCGSECYWQWKRGRPKHSLAAPATSARAEQETEA